MRGFQVAKNFENVNLPVRATAYSAGYDIETIEEIVILPNTVVVAKTGLKAYMGSDEVLKIYPRSSLAIKKHVCLANSVGIIDKDYYENPSNDGHIMIALYNFGVDTVVIPAYERIAQGIFEKYLLIDNDNQNQERSGGFGSTGK